jgi:hypothetical protein
MSNYVTLVNKLLVRLNEVPLDPGGVGFGATRNVQELAKNAINDSVRLIVQTGEEWPYLKVTYTQTLTPNVRVYNFPANFASADWETFYLKKSATNSPKFLPSVDYQKYIQNYRTLDDENTTGGIPEMVYDTLSDSFGVYPNPNAAYEIENTYWSVSADMQAYTDECIIPTRFDHVIVDGAMMIMMRFRSNEQSAAVHQNNFENGIRLMRRTVIDQPLRVTSTMIEGSTNAR